VTDGAEGVAGEGREGLEGFAERDAGDSVDAGRQPAGDEGGTLLGGFAEDPADGLADEELFFGHEAAARDEAAGRAMTYAEASGLTHTRGAFARHLL
jgi:hypothetical protein